MAPEQRQRAGTRAAKRSDTLSRRHGHQPAKSWPLPPRPPSQPGTFIFSRFNNEPGGRTPSPATALILLVFIRVAAALTNGIADCDETYNYWEPLHRIMYGTGLQTWEYSPEFAIRSYAFLLPYAAAARLGTFLVSLVPASPSLPSKLIAFYSVRVTQGVICAVAEVSLYNACLFRFGRHSARILLALLAASPGMFRASTEFLPSSFAMIALTFAISHWMMGRFRAAVVCVAIGSGLGWPFAALLAIPMACHISLRRGLVSLVSTSAACALLLLGFMVPIDSFYFGRLVVAPLNIVMYNIFSPPGAGPNAFGVEPWTFYAFNLALNCNVSLLLLLSYPVQCLIDVLVCPICRDGPQRAREYRLSRGVFLSPTFLWLLVFVNQPHKEERFLAPIYPLIALVAAVALNDWCTLLVGSLRARRHIISCLVILLAFVLGTSRVAMQLHSFGAPFRVFTHFTKHELQDGLGPRNAPSAFSSSHQDINICVGKEWYRFPSHFFLPAPRYRMRFTRSLFSGLLPKYFDEAEDGMRKVPRGMNMLNNEDPLQYVREPAAENCHYYLDLDLSHRSDDEPQSAKDENPIPKLSRHVLSAEKFVDLIYSSPIYRAFWIPSTFSSVSGADSPVGVVYGNFGITRNLNLLPIMRQAEMT
jgi:alpha-1,2-mannosyltransferase